MCQKRNSVNAKIGNRLVRVDACLRDLIESLQLLGIDTLMCCCGHGKYPPSVIVRTDYGETILEIFSGEILDEGRTYYKIDEDGLYYIPKLVKEI